MQLGALDREGTVEFEGYKVWFGIAGRADEPGKAPLLLVHGGPGLPHDALLPLARLWATGRRVIFYDQLGCGNSSRPADPHIWQPELFVRELAAVRRALNLERAHVYAHSYGGVIALNYALTRPGGLVSLTLADTFPSVPALAAGWQSLLDTMPSQVAAAIRALHESGSSEDPGAEALFNDYFISQHISRSAMPPTMGDAFAGMGREVYEAMHGPRWFAPSGRYKDWDVTGRLSEIDVPVLVLCGEYDQCVPALSKTLQAGIPGAELFIFPNVAHMPYCEAPVMHDRVVTTFLDRVEASAAANT